MATSLKCEHGKFAGLCPACRQARLSARDPSLKPVERRVVQGGSAELFFVYENWTADGHKAKVHRGDCSHCNDGRGKDPDASDRNGQWHGGYSSREEAREHARSLTRNATDCSFCGSR